MMCIKQIPSLILITLGAAMAAAALEIFLIPNSIIDGGLNGVSIILNKVFGGSLSIYIIVLNLPFILLALVYGGLLLGVGVGLVIKEGGCLDGTEAVAITLSKRVNLSVGQIVFIFNIFIYGSAIFVFGVDRALYSLLTYFITFKIIDIVSEGLEQAKMALIVTDKEEKISEEIYKRLGRTVTIISGKGMVSKSEKTILYTVITRLEIQELRDIVQNADVSSFVTITDVNDIIGNHIKKISEPE